MAPTVFRMSLTMIVIIMTIATAPIPTRGHEMSCNAETTCQLGKEKFIVKTTVTPSTHQESQKATNTTYTVVVRNLTAMKYLHDEMETTTSDSASRAAYCSVKETVDMDIELGALLDAREGAMVTLVAGQARLTAHRAVLAVRSPLFADILCHGTKETSSSEVAIPDVEGPVLRQLVAYLYTLQAPQLPCMAHQLLAAAAKFGLSALKSACEVQVAAQLSVETAADTAVLAIRHSSATLRQAAISFIRAHTDQVMATRGWADAVRHQPEEVIEIYRLLAEQPVVTSTPPAADTQPTTEATSLPDTSHGQTPVAAASPSPTSSPPDDAVSRLRGLSAEEKGQRLIQAAKEGAEEEVRSLLAAGAEVMARDEDSATALHWAAAWGHVEVARCLLGAGAGLDARNRWQVTPLYLAARWGNVGVLRLLLAASADINASSDDGMTPLHSAAWNGEAEVAAVLLEAGADRRTRDHDGNTPLDLARQQNDQRLIDLLS